jgi:acetolactate synthase-1/2/3 large subunit
MHHEQSAAMAADGFSRSSGRLGVAIATSGPGATNLITGIAGCFYDSIPAVFVTGQVSTTRMAGTTGVRQIGFQETPIIDMVSGITKGAFPVLRPQDTRRVMEEALWAATTGRPGPVLIDVPDDVQRQYVIWSELDSLEIPALADLDLTSDREFVRAAMAQAERPVLVGGAGVVLAGAEDEFRDFAEAWGAPVVLTWGAPHLLPQEHPQRIGLFGTHGGRHANFVVQNADLILSVGSRLDTKATGSPVTSFARGATKVMVDIDASELGKFDHFGLSLDRGIQADARDFLQAVMGGPMPQVPAKWTDYCSGARATCDEFDSQQRVGAGIDPYSFMAALGSSAPDELDVFVDTGCALPWLMTGFPLRAGQRILHDLNNTAMGWSLPASIGGTLASPKRPAICVIGDGSLMMTMHDLVTLASINENARVVLIDNSGYSMIRQTQDQWLGSWYYSSSQSGGLRFPDYRALAESTGFHFIEAESPEGIDSALSSFWAAERPTFLRVRIDPAWRVVPQVKFGRPNEDMDPLLPRAEFERLMLVEPLPQSRSADA